MTNFSSIAEVCRGWWDTCIAAETGAARRARAELRRAAGVTDALGVSATHELNRWLLRAGHDLRQRRDGPDRLALIAVALAQVEQDGRETAAQLFGGINSKASELEKPLSGLRFNALIRAREPRQLTRHLVRALRIIEGRANVRRLAADLYWWNEKTRADWCFDYHGAADAKPTPEEANT